VATRTIHVSDLTGNVLEDDQRGKLTIRQHPKFAETPIELEVAPEEVASLEAAADEAVIVEYLAPGARRPSSLVVRLEVFDGLADNMGAVLMEAVAAQHQASRGSVAKGQRRSRADRIDYGTIEHAGKPHRGRITDAEKEIVRSNLDEVNKRLRAAGLREIDPSDATLRERYGLTG
jgi:hypothetical protein